MYDKILMYEFECHILTIIDTEVCYDSTQLVKDIEKTCICHDKSNIWLLMLPYSQYVYSYCTVTYMQYGVHLLTSSVTVSKNMEWLCSLFEWIINRGRKLVINIHPKDVENYIVVIIGFEWLSSLISACCP